MKKLIKFFTATVAAVCLFVFCLVVYYNYTLPNYFYVIKDHKLDINSRFEITAETVDNINSEKPFYGVDKILTTLGLPVNINDAYEANTFETRVKQEDTENLTLKLFGVIPIKNTTVQKVEESMLVPGGNPFGVKMFTKGVMVVGISDIETSSGVINPAKKAGVKMGDVIYLINGQEVKTNEEVGEIISKSEGKTVKLNLERKGKELNLKIKPALSTDNIYKAGIWVRDSSAGIGTITFYDPAEGTFAGLGHGICDVDTGDILPLLSGEIVNVNINSVERSVVGSPGELKGTFSPGFAIGNVLMNNETGVFGQSYYNSSEYGAIPMALKQQIKTGPAKILATISGSKPREYDVIIEKVNANSSVKTKNMVIKVIDSKLLEKTGGIVQGMSGSPIIQNDMLVGAVTHVFVNDPVKGYGIFAENMLVSQNELGLDRAG